MSDLRLQLQLHRGDFALAADTSFPAQGITVLFGPSGCGKTSLLRAIAGLDKAPGARLQFGDDIWQDNEQYVPTHERPLGYVFQEASLFMDRDVRRNLDYGFRRTPEEVRRIQWEEAVALLGLEPLLDRRPGTLSGGERQRVAIGRALLTSPRLLLMDEPLASLDRESKAGILPYLERLDQELDLPILYVTHDLQEAAQLGDTLVLMEPGRIRQQGPLNELLTSLELPFASSADALAVVGGEIVRHEPEDGLVWVRALGDELAVVGEQAVGQQMRLRIRASDVAIALERPAVSSVLNVIEAEVTELAEKGSAQMMIRLQAGEDHLLSHITRRSARALELQPGKSVFAQVKCSALST